MFSYPGADEVTEDLGDKVIQGFSTAVDKTRKDLATYRELYPDWVSQHSERGLANWLHDRLWQHLVVQLDHLDHVNFKDKEPTREFTVGLRYRFRVKRHDDSGAVRTYPTQTALNFMSQAPVQLPLDGYDEVRLMVGYAWDSETRNVGAGLLSLRKDQDELVWQIELPPTEGGGTAGGDPWSPVLPETGPAGPTIEVSDADEEDSGAGTA